MRVTPQDEVSLELWFPQEPASNTLGRMRSKREKEERAQSLSDLGLTALEAMVYGELHDSGPMTSYGLAKLIGKPVANVYKAAYSLEEKGAILVEEGEPRVCRAVSAGELLSRLEREFKDKKKRVKKALASPPKRLEDDNICRLGSASQALERAHMMIKSAKEHLIVDAFPDLLESLRPSIEKASESGVAVLVEAYKPVAFKGCKVVLHPGREDILPHWPGDILMVNKDGLETLQALLQKNGDGVLSAFWSASVFLACQSYVAAINNFGLSCLMNELEGETTPAKMKSKLKAIFPYRMRHTRGFKKLRK